jgi:ubiquinone/menaquinone biosynthesis C-methylase UbiE
MTYVAAGAEAIPFEDGHFDFVSTFNSLDHVDDVDAAIAETARVTRPGGTLLLICDVNHEPTPMEPHTFGWEIIDRFAGEWEVIDRRDYERPTDNMYENLRQHDRRFDHTDPRPRPGVVAAVLRRH